MKFKELFVEAKAGERLSLDITSFNELSSVIGKFKRKLTKPEEKIIAIMKAWGHLNGPDIKLAQSFFSAIGEIVKDKINLEKLMSGQLSDSEKQKLQNLRFSKDSATAGKLLKAHANRDFVDYKKIQSITKVMIYVKPLVMEPLIPKQYKYMIMDKNSNRVFD